MVNKESTEKKKENKRDTKSLETARLLHPEAAYKTKDLTTQQHSSPTKLNKLNSPKV